MVLIGSDRFVEHQPPDGHPERPDRARVMSRVARRWVESGGVLTAPRVAPAEELTRVHAAPYVDQISHTAGQRLQLDPDTYTSDDSYEIALLAAGATIDAVARAASGSATIDAAARPTGPRPGETSSN